MSYSRHAIKYSPVNHDLVIPRRNVMQALVNFATGREIPQQRGAYEDAYGTVVRRIRQSLVEWVPATAAFSNSPPFGLFKIGTAETQFDGTVKLTVEDADLDTFNYAVNERYEIFGGSGWVRVVTPGYDYWVRSTETLALGDRVSPSDGNTGVVKDTLGDFRVMSASYEEGAFNYSKVRLDPVVSWPGIAMTAASQGEIVKVKLGVFTEKYRRVWLEFGEVAEGDSVFVGRNDFATGSEADQIQYGCKWWAIQRPCPGDIIS